MRSIAMTFDDTTATWKRMLRTIMTEGHKVAPQSAGSDWRGRTTKEVLTYTAVISAAAPVVRSPGRKMRMDFLAGEAAWILSGDNRTSTIGPVAPRKLLSFSDDGARFFGAYGPKLVDQMSYVVGTLARDPSSRQAVSVIWREQPRETKDVPCTVAVQHLQRDGFLHTVVTMRSSDAWSGWVYDVFNFSMVGALVLLELRDRQRRNGRPVDGGVDWRAVNLGSLRLTAASQHLYAMDFGPVEDILKDEPGDLLDYAPIDLHEFETPQELIDHLWALARKDGTARHAWLRELYA